MSRSFLFVPGDSERKLEKAGGVGADALIVDLEDAVAPEAKEAARNMAADYVRDRDDTWVRINPVDTDMWEADIEAVMPAQPVGIILPKPRHAHDAVKLSERIDVLENHHGIEHGQTRIIALCTEHPEALLTLHSYVGTVPRLAGLSWGAEDLSSELGAREQRGPDGEYTHVYEMARSLCLLGAVKAGVAPIETVQPEFRDLEARETRARRVRAQGFRGMLAIHPAQIAPINAAFTPSAEELAHAQAIVQAFADNPGAGTVALDGNMLDRPHLALAERLLAEAGDN